MPNANQLTADTITDDQIQALRAEAFAAGDIAQVQCCDIALGGPSLLPHAAPASHKSMNIEQRAQARAYRGKCADAINAAHSEVAS